jgi:hypothetical protein
VVEGQSAFVAGHQHESRTPHVAFNAQAQGDPLR